MALTKKTECGKNQFELEFSVDKETFESAVQSVFSKKKASISVPGFRKGKAPRHIVEKLYGKEKIENALKFGKDLKDRYSVLWMYYDLMVH